MLLLKTSLITSKSSDCCGKSGEQAKLTPLLGEQSHCSLLCLQRNLAGVTKTTAAWKHSCFQTPGAAQRCYSTSLTCIFPWQGFPRHLSVLPVSFFHFLGTADSSVLCHVGTKHQAQHAEAPWKWLSLYRHAVQTECSLPHTAEILKDPNPPIWERQKDRRCC